MENNTDLNQSNSYTVGSLLWAERNRANEFQRIIHSVIYDADYSLGDARRDFQALMTDTLMEG